MHFHSKKLKKRKSSEAAVVPVMNINKPLLHNFHVQWCEEDFLGEYEPIPGIVLSCLGRRYAPIVRASGGKLIQERFAAFGRNSSLPV